MKTGHKNETTRWVWACLCALMAFFCLFALIGATAARALSAARESAAVRPAESEPPVMSTPRPTPKSMTVYVATSSGAKELTMTGGTVRDALHEAGINPDEDDAIAPALYMLIENGLRIEYTQINTELVTVEEAIAYKTTRRDDGTIEKGEEKTAQEGEDGVRETVYKVTYTDGKETFREKLSTEVTKEPTDRIILTGTKITDERVSVPALVVLKNDERVNNDIAPKKSEIKKTVYVEATAYTHTGNKTATGTWPKLGTIAVNPKQIPYGTRLYVEGYGYGVAGDTGAFRHTERFQIDLFMDTVKECMTWGRKRNVKVYILE